MISGDIAIDVSSWAMTQHMTQAQVAAENIVRARSVGGTANTTNFSSMILAVDAALATGDKAAVRAAISESSSIVAAGVGRVTVDNEVANLVSAEGRFKVLAHGISKKLGLMSLAANGGR